MTRGTAAPRQREWWQFLPPLLMVAAGLAVYQRSFAVPFLLDDQRVIVENPLVHQLRPLATLLFRQVEEGVAGRPVVNLSLGLNYALGGLRVWDYHAVNLTLHLLAALTLYGLVRRTLLLPSLHERYDRAAPWIALAAVSLWVVHPLQTASVTYIIQRAELFVGLWTLLTLYAVLRGSTARRPGPWHVAAVIACALGMASKPVMAPAPLAVLLYDRVFLAGAWSEALRRRRLYLGLAASWLVLTACLLSAPSMERPSAGFGVKETTPLIYAATQPGVILHYLRLVFWPHPLVFDYAWPFAKTAEAVILPALLLGLAAVGTAVVWRRDPRVGMLPVWFFLLLAPTSSVIPLRDAAFEHRMYLPLAAVIVLTVMGAETLLRRLVPHARVRWGLAGGLWLAVVVACGMLTISRHADYRTKISLWQDTVEKRPLNHRAHTNLGQALSEAGRDEEAVTHLLEAIRLHPEPAAYTNLGIIAIKAGNHEDAIRHLTEALHLNAEYAEAHNNLGVALMALGRWNEAEEHFNHALRLKPHYGEAHFNLGLAHLAQERRHEAIARFREALRFKPEYVKAHHYLAKALAERGQLDEAIVHARDAVRLAPDFAEAHYDFARLLKEQGGMEDAIAHYRESLRLNPSFAEAHNNLGALLGEAGKLGEAIGHLTEALRLKPDYAEAHNNLGNAFLGQGKLEEAMAHYTEALCLDPENASARDNLDHVKTTQRLENREQF